MYYQPKPLVIAERFRFYQRSQNSTESVLDYAAELRRLTITCEFGDFLDSALRDRFVCGLRTEQIQKSLLTAGTPEDPLTMSRAVELAQAKEALPETLGTSKAHQQPHYSKVSGSGDHSPSQGGQPCYRCGKPGHNSAECRFRQAKCHKCGKQGHIAPACRSKKKPADRRNPPRKVKQVETGHSSEGGTDDLGEYALSVANIGDKSPRPIRVDLHMSGKPVSMELDTGAAVSVMSNQAFKKLFPQAKLNKSQLILKTYTGQIMKVVGEFPVDVRYKEQQKSLDLVIVEGGGPPLLGRNWLKHIQLDWKTIGTVAREESVSTIHDKYSEVFSDELGTIQPFTTKLSISTQYCEDPSFARPVQSLTH